MKISNFAAYIAQLWRNKPDTSTPLSAERLRHIEDGIKGNSDAIEAIAAAVVNQIVNDPDKIASMAALYAVNQKVSALDGKVGDTAQLPDGATDVVTAISKQNSDMVTNGYNINPNIVQTLFAIVNGWDTGVQNVPSFVKNNMCILITVWVYPTAIGKLEAERNQLIFNGGHFAVRTYQNQNWGAWS